MKIQRKQATEKAMREAIKGARQRAAAKGLPFDLDLNYLLAKAEAQDFRCELTGVPFYSSSPVEGAWRVNPYAPSLDRITPSLGYTRDNVRIVTFAVNAMLLDWGEDLFLRVVGSYRYHRAKRERSPLTHGNPPPLT
jgi:hypothetical protein